jgi:formylglycine-generating enzyme required for sulfatase activity
MHDSRNTFRLFADATAKPSHARNAVVSMSCVLVVLSVLELAWPTIASAEPLEEITNSIGMKLVRLPAGKLRPTREIKDYGGVALKELNKPGSKKGKSPKTKPAPKISDQPDAPNAVQAPQVAIGDDIYMGTCEVTKAQFGKFREQISKQVFQLDGIHKIRDKAETAEPDHPMGNVFWLEAVGFCYFLSELPEEKLAGRKYRLPTAAEWEYACRAGSTTKYSFGDSPDMLSEFAWFGRDASGKLQPVGTKKANAWGLFDMHGNASEWCQDLVLNEAPLKGIAPLDYGVWIAQRRQAMMASGIKGPNPNPMRAIGGCAIYLPAEQHTSSAIRSNIGEAVVGWKGEFMWHGDSRPEIGFRVAMTLSDDGAQAAKQGKQTSTGNAP